MNKPNNPVANINYAPRTCTSEMAVELMSSVDTKGNRYSVKQSSTTILVETQYTTYKVNLAEVVKSVLDYELALDNYETEKTKTLRNEYKRSKI